MSCREASSCLNLLEMFRGRRTPVHVEPKRGPGRPKKLKAMPLEDTAMVEVDDAAVVAVGSLVAVLAVESGCSLNGPRGPLKGPRGPSKGIRGLFKGHRGLVKETRGPFKGPRVQ